MSLRHGSVPKGRRMFGVSGDDTAALGAAYGLAQVFCIQRDDMLGRNDVTWSFLVLVAAKDGSDE